MIKLAENNLDTLISFNLNDLPIDKHQNSKMPQIIPSDSLNQTNAKSIVGKTIRFQNLNFSTNSKEISDSKDLEKLAVFLKSNPNLKISIEGHTDKVGDDVSNQKLSQARAMTVKDFLFSKGVKNDNMTTIGYGETRPIAENEAENRRVEIVFFGKITQLFLIVKCPLVCFFVILMAKKAVYLHKRKR